MKLFCFFFLSEWTKIGKQQKNKLTNWHMNGNLQCVCFYLVIHTHLVIFYLLFFCPMANFGPSSTWQPHSTEVSHCVLSILSRRLLKFPQTSLLKTSTISHIISAFSGTQTINFSDCKVRVRVRVILAKLLCLCLQTKLLWVLVSLQGHTIFRNRKVTSIFLFIYLKGVEFIISFDFSLNPY